MPQRIRQRFDATLNHGYTMIELLVVVVILGILVAVAVPAYLDFRARAADNSAKANLQTALPSAEAYYADKGTYVGMDRKDLAQFDSRVSRTLTVVHVTPTTYCLTDTVGSHTWSVAGPTPTQANFRKNDSCA